MIFLVVEPIHDFNLKSEDEFIEIQKALVKKVKLENSFLEKDIKLVAGVDLSYWTQNDKQYGVCCIVVVNYKTKKALKTVYSIGEIKTPYITGFLAFRELPLFIETVKKLSYEPDIFIFDGNGYLHYKHMGIATHASFFINKPTIGVAKSYLKIDNNEYEMPDKKPFAFTDIVIDGEVYGRALRTKEDIKPIFISCGNYININTATEIIINLIGKESRVPIPTRLADLETHNLRRNFREFYE